MGTYLLLGLGLGGLYALAALGIVAIHRGSRVLNLAHGAVALWGAYTFVELRDEYRVAPGWAALVVAVLAAALGAVLYLGVIRPLRDRTALTKMVATLGVLVVLTSAAREAFGVQSMTVPSWLPNQPVDVLGATIGADRVILFAVALLATVALSWWSARVRLPLATRAMSEHEEAATALGFSPHVLGAANWALGCVLAAIAGILIAPITGLPGGVSLLVVPALAAALVGRFDSYWWALAGGLLIGVSESLVTKYVTEPGWTAAVPFLVAIGVLLARHERGANRLEAQHAIPVGLLRSWIAGVVLAGMAGFVALATTQYLDAATLSVTFAVLALSLVVLIGFANQISLAQMGIAGIGAFAAGRLSAAGALPFEVAPVAGALVGALVGLLVGLPALRVRGVNLAVVTMGLSLAIERVLLQNASLTGGLEGIQPDEPSIFGASVEPIVYPRRYAFVCLFWLAVALVAVMLVRRSSLGRRMLAMRTNERAAAAQGVGVAGAKLTAFAISSALAGMAGVLLAFRQPLITFSPFNFFESINLVAQAVVGGIAVASGALVAGLLAPAGVVFRFTQEHQIDAISEHYTTLFGIGLILVLRFHPGGLAQIRPPRPDPTGVAKDTAPQRPPTALHATSLVVTFGGVHAVSGASITVEPGQVTGLIGPNGAGKTTLLDALCGFARVSSGRVLLGDYDITRASPSARARAGIGRAFQRLELFEDLTVAQNLLVATESAGRSGMRLPVAAAELSEQLDLRRDFGRKPPELPLGRRRVAAIVRALATNPAVLLLDEPGAGLSLTEITELGTSISGLARDYGLGVLIVDHDMGLVMATCDDIVVLVEGEVVACAPPEEIVLDASVQAAYLGEATVVVP